jgi:transcriptional regulator with XRE-family HTH domain
MNQESFAALLGVSQGMVSKYESGEYNFTIGSLNEICSKIGLEFNPDIIPQRVPKNNIILIRPKSNPRINLENVGGLEVIA